MTEVNALTCICFFRDLYFPALWDQMGSFWFVLNIYYCLLKEPAHEIMVLITQATSEGSGEPTHPRSLARAFAVRTLDEGFDQKADI